jgi:hypothetical protein
MIRGINKDRACFLQPLARLKISDFISEVGNPTSAFQMTLRTNIVPPIRIEVRGIDDGIGLIAVGF